MHLMALIQMIETAYQLMIYSSGDIVVASLQPNEPLEDVVLLFWIQEDIGFGTLSDMFVGF
jgi:hypothetical protein